LQVIIISQFISEYDDLLNFMTEEFKHLSMPKHCHVHSNYKMEARKPYERQKN